MLLLKHIETESAHIYESRGLLISFVIIVFLVALSLFIGILIWGILLIDLVPVGFKQFVARLRGKSITMSGSWFGGGAPRLVIQK